MIGNGANAYVPTTNMGHLNSCNRYEMSVAHLVGFCFDDSPAHTRVPLFPHHVQADQKMQRSTWKAQWTFGARFRLYQRKQGL
jgi:hypothetical protein